MREILVQNIKKINLSFRITGRQENGLQVMDISKYSGSERYDIFLLH